MTMTAFAVFFSHWRRHPFQLLTLVLGLALATGLWVAVQAINSEARASYAKAETMLDQGSSRRIVAKEGTLKLRDYVTLRRAGWPVLPLLEGTLNFGSQRIDLIGVDLLNSPSLPILSERSNGTSDPGSFVELVMSPGVIFLHPDSSNLLPRNTESYTKEYSNSVPHGVVIADVSVVSRLLDDPFELTAMFLRENESGFGIDTTELPGHLRLVQSQPAGSEMTRLTDSFHLNLTAFGFLAFAVGLFIVQGTVALALEQRRGMFRTLRCLGLSLFNLICALAMELAIITLAAGVLGLLIGYFLAALLLPDVSATLSGLYGAEIDAGLALRANWVVSGLSMAALGTAAASAQAFVTLWKLPILQLPSTKARGQQVLRSFGTGAALGGGLILVGFAVLLFGRSLFGGFAFLAGLMLGAAMILPFFLSRFLRLGKSLSRHPLSQWLWADSAAQLPGLSLALMALLLALATNIGVGTMVSSFRLTFQGWMDQRLSSELYVTAKDDAQGGEIETWVTQQGYRVLPIRSHELELNGQTIKIYGVREDQSYRENWPMLEAVVDSWEGIGSGRGILINEQLSRRSRIGVGDHLDLPSGWPTEILGIYSDYGNPVGQVIVSLPKLLDMEPAARNQRFGVRMPKDDVPKLINNLKERFELPRENLIDQASIKARSLAVFDQTFVVTAALNLLTLGVAGFSILTSLATLWEQRLPQLAPIWAMGVPRRTLATLDILRSLLIASLTAILALPLGILLAWVLLDVINTEAFGWRLPLHVFPTQWLRLIALALIAAALAALISAWRLYRLQPNDLLKVFSNDR